MSYVPDLKEATREWYDGLAGQWPATISELLLHELVRRLDVAPGSTILDAGCANGVWSIALAELGYRILGVDLSPEMIQLAQQRVRELTLSSPEMQARYVIGDVEHLELEDASIDATICFNVLDFTPHPGRALLEMQRVLKPGGRLLLLTLGACSPVKLDPGHERWRRFLPDPPSVIPLNDILPWEIEALLLELGWDILDQQPRIGATVRGPAAGYTDAGVRALSDRVLQQTVATAWEFLAQRR